MLRLKPVDERELILLVHRQLRDVVAFLYFFERLTLRTRHWSLGIVILMSLQLLLEGLANHASAIAPQHLALLPHLQEILLAITK